MSRRKDRERFLSMKHLNPDYQGFRGQYEEPDRAGNTPLQAIECTKCGRRRNVAVGVAMEEAENYICLSCREEAEEEPPEGEETQEEEPVS
jgi:DNA-directed RNA polymerase subunit RPC12/RpoP